LSAFYPGKKQLLDTNLCAKEFMDRIKKKSSIYVELYYRNAENLFRKAEILLISVDC